MPTSQASLDALCVNAIRTLAIDMVEQANSGHPGLPMGAAPMAYALWQRTLKHDPTDPSWPDRDRFVLSAGHGSALLYALLHLAGYPLTLEDLKAFRQQGSLTPGHPEFGLTQGVEATTGPLGQGAANAVGMAIAERRMAHMFNRPGHTIVDHWTYALVSDGDLMEGISAESVALAGHLGLGKLIFLYDSNDITLDGPTSMAFSENILQRFESAGWNVRKIKDGDTNIDSIHDALSAAKENQDRPTLIEIKTTIGFGSPNKAGSSGAHGSPLGADEVLATKKALGWDATEPFTVPDSARKHFSESGARGREANASWHKRFDTYAKAFPELADLWRRAHARELPKDWDQGWPSFEGKKIATREASGIVIQCAAEKLRELIGGDADLSGSTKTTIKSDPDFSSSGDGRNIRYGVREHAMGAIANGIVYHGGLRPFVSTFFCFADYMRAPVRLAALSHLPVIYVWTHDSIVVGEDGPTHQPVEHLMSLRAIPRLAVVRPADGAETVEAWKWALSQKDRPVALVLTRQGLPNLDETADASGLVQGAYIKADASDGKPKAILIATGSEVSLAIEARTRLEAEGTPTRVVSMPCWETFEEQDQEYRDRVIPRDVPCRVSLEAGVTLGWHRWVGDDGFTLGIDRFGNSAPGEQNYFEYGFHVDHVVKIVKAKL